MINYLHYHLLYTKPPSELSFRKRKKIQFLSRKLLLKYLPALLMISQTAAGVAGTMDLWSRHSLPMLTMWKPSTSFSGAMALHTARSLMCSEGGEEPTQTLLINCYLQQWDPAAGILVVRDVLACAAMCWLCLPGSGSWTSRPLTLQSRFILSISSSSSSWETELGRTTVSLEIPARHHRRRTTHKTCV